MQKTPNSYTIGHKFESKASHILAQKGYRIIKSNYRGAFAQVDLIAESKNYLAFIEVKKTTPLLYQKTLKDFRFKQKNRLLAELNLYHETFYSKQTKKTVLILLEFAKNPTPDLYLYYLYNP